MVSASELHRKNRLDWIGKEHNRAMERFRFWMTVPNKPNTTTCDAVAEAVIAYVPKTRPVRDAMRSRVRSTLTMLRCDDVRSAPLQTLQAQPASLARRLTRQDSVSAVALSAVSAMASAVTGASDADALATTLSAILADTTGLDTLSTQFMLGAASVAQNSFEYWTDSAAQSAFGASFSAEYGACIISGTPVSVCIGGGEYDAGLRRRAPINGPLARLASWSRPVCKVDGTAIAEYDVVGFASGFIGGIFFPPPWGGPLTTGLVAAGGASIGKGLWEYGKYLHCAFTS